MQGNMKAKKGASILVAALTLGLSVIEPASAASVLDAGMKTALTTGFTDLKDTLVDIVGTSWPFILAMTAVGLAPSLVKKFAKLGAK